MGNLARNMATGSGRAGRDFMYLFDRALWFLDGTVIEIEGSFYFEDKTGNGRHWPIVGYDWADRKVNGFPYKTAATTSAPADDAVLIAADLNNYLYAADGTPNQLSVVSMFQNVDYENLIYNYHFPQILTEHTGVEVMEPHVKYRVMYDHVLTAEEQPGANSFFKVPSIGASVKWVSPTGSNIADGSEASPWETLQYAQTNASVGDVIYAKTGAYTEPTYLDAPCAMKGIGDISFHAAVADAYQIYVKKANLTFENFTLIGNSGTSYGFRIEPAYTGVSVNNINEIDVGKWFVQSQAVNTTVKNCILNSDFVSVGLMSFQTGFVADGNYFGGDTTSYIYGTTIVGTMTAKHNIVAGTANYLINVGVSYDELIAHNNLVTGNTIVIYSPITAAGDILDTYNDISGSSRLLDNREGAASGMVRVFGNKAESSSTSPIVFVDEKDHEIYNNLIICTEAGTPIRVNASSGRYYTSIYNNYTQTNKDGGMISVGSEADLAEDTLYGSIYNNHCVGSFAVNGSVNAIHGIFVWNNPNVNVHHNRIRGCSLSLVLKANGTDYTNGKYYANDIDGRVILKGVKNAKVIGNTIIINNNISGGASFGVNILATGSYNSTGNIIKNNIIIIDAIGVDNYAIQADDVNQTFTADNNIYYNVNTPLNRIAPTGYTFTQWQTAGYDSNGTELITLAAVKALFNDYDNGDYSLKDGSLAKGFCLPLDDAYKTGLKSTTKWGNEVPIVETINQPSEGNWNAGAIIG